MSEDSGTVRFRRTAPLLRAGAQHKLTNVLGRKLGIEYYEEVCAGLGITDIASPDDALRFANVLLEQGGLLSSVGRSIEAQARICGANEP